MDIVSRGVTILWRSVDMKRLAKLFILVCLCTNAAYAAPPIQFIKGEVGKVRELLKISVKEDPKLRKKSTEN